MIRSFPFTEELKANYQYHYSQVLNEEGAIDADRLKRSNIWQYKHLPSGVQNAIANVISDMCRNPGLKALPGSRQGMPQSICSARRRTCPLRCAIDSDV